MLAYVHRFGGISGSAKCCRFNWKNRLTSRPEKVRNVSPGSKPEILAKLDQRTREARLVRETRAGLIEHVGGKPTATQAALIERAVQLTLRTSLMDQRFAASAFQEEGQSKTYLAWSGALNRTLRELGMKAAPRRAATLEDHLAARANGVAA